MLTKWLSQALELVVATMLPSPLEKRLGKLKRCEEEHETLSQSSFYLEIGGGWACLLDRVSCLLSLP